MDLSLVEQSRESFEAMLMGKRCRSPLEVAAVDGADVDGAYCVDRDALRAPMLLRGGAAACGMRLPGGENFGVDDVALLVGPEATVPVIDVAEQEQQGRDWTLGEWASYFARKEAGAHKVLNVLSLEIGGTRLGDAVAAPRFVRDLDWIDCTPADERPKVQKYCLMSAGGSFTDWHVDMGGSSVWYHVVSGEKRFWCAAPTEENLGAYARWISSRDQSATWFGDCVGADQVAYFALGPGMTLSLPSGWLHAVYTPEDSLVFGGNYLHTLAARTQFAIFDVEKACRVDRSAASRAGSRRRPRGRAREALRPAAAPAVAAARQALAATLKACDASSDGDAAVWSVDGGDLGALKAKYGVSKDRRDTIKEKAAPIPAARRRRRRRRRARAVDRLGAPRSAARVEDARERGGQACEDRKKATEEAYFQKARDRAQALSLVDAALEAFDAAKWLDAARARASDPARLAALDGAALRATLACWAAQHDGAPRAPTGRRRPSTGASTGPSARSVRAQAAVGLRNGARADRRGAPRQARAAGAAARRRGAAAAGPEAAEGRRARRRAPRRRARAAARRAPAAKVDWRDALKAKLAKKPAAPPPPPASTDDMLRAAKAATAADVVVDFSRPDYDALPDRVHAAVAAVADPALASKITGMFVDGYNAPYLENLLGDAAALRAAVDEALAVLRSAGQLPAAPVALCVPSSRDPNARTVVAHLEAPSAFPEVVVTAYEKNLDALAALEPVALPVVGGGTELASFLNYLATQAKAAVCRLDDATKAFIEPQSIDASDPVLYVRPFHAPRRPPP
ncbi:demethylase [Aureococcus anophagefferens]|uniref:Demethylase n=1 Tax=Aureococcus anophagefferens TaxID=44056 RepID=A0ABR1G8R5_AURAN